MACSGVVTGLWSFLGPHSTDSCPLLLWQFLSLAPFFVRTLSGPSLLSSPWSRITFIPPSSSPVDEMALLCVLVFSSPYGLPAQYILTIPQFIFHFLLSFLSSFSLGSASPPCTSYQPMYWRWLHHVAVPFYFRTTSVAPPPRLNLFLPWARAILFPLFSPILSLFSVFHSVYSSSYCILSCLDATDLLP